MPIDLSTLVGNVHPERTILLFGSGSAIPSGAPSVRQLQAHFEKIFGVPAGDYTLAEQTGIIEQRTQDRSRLITELRTQFKGVRPTGAILNLPLYRWKSIFTTNYDDLIEKCYERRGLRPSVYSSNFDFRIRLDPESIQIFKIHGTIGKDESFGDKSRLILTESDYDLTEEYRESLYDRLRSDLAGAHLIIIGHSLADKDIQAVVNRAVSLNTKSGSGGRISLLLYNRDDGRAALFEARGIEVCFGGVDDFFAGLVGRDLPPAQIATLSSDPLDLIHALRPATIDVAHALNARASDASSMYNGWPASYSDIAAGLTFRRDVANEIDLQLRETDQFIAVLLGASGVGKTTAMRQVMADFVAHGFFAWEHKQDLALLPERWFDVAVQLGKQGSQGILMVDEAHSELPAVNDLIEDLAAGGCKSLKLILISSSHQWNLRVKAPPIYKDGKQYLLSKVQGNEIDRLLALVEANNMLRPLVERSFAGFNRSERRRRLIQKCDADMFVCLKNIFSSDKLDDIILREYAGLDVGSQEIYRAVAAMESAGVRVHRQLVMRLLGIRATNIGVVLAKLSDIIHEETVDGTEGIYAWYGRHKVIMHIVAEHKYYDFNKRFDLFSKVIEAISPTYDIEIRTIKELCNLETGISTIPEKAQQNILLRKMMSIAPAERVPRHRLLRNLIDMNEFDRAETEIRLFQTDFGLDGPATRYKIILATARAVRSQGLLHEDRVVLIDKARQLASSAASRFRMNKGILTAYCEVGLETAKLTGRSHVFDTAIAEFKAAEDRIGDPQVSRIISQYERRMAGIATEPAEYTETLPVED